MMMKIIIIKDKGMRVQNVFIVQYLCTVVSLTEYEVKLFSCNILTPLELS
jgi:hypothetical protein